MIWWSGYTSTNYVTIYYTEENRLKRWQIWAIIIIVCHLHKYYYYLCVGRNCCNASLGVYNVGKCRRFFICVHSILIRSYGNDDYTGINNEELYARSLQCKTKGNVSSVINLENRFFSFFVFYFHIFSFMLSFSESINNVK